MKQWLNTMLLEEKKVIDVKANENYTLVITFNNGEKRLMDCKTFIKDNYCICNIERLQRI